MTFNWRISENFDDVTVQNLAKKLSVPKSLVKVLLARGFSDFDSAKKFLNPSLKDLHDPYLMLNMEKTVDRILLAKQAHELIWVHGDYDADGTSSVAMLVDFLRSIGCRALYYIPDRFTEGFGLSEVSINKAKAAGVSLIITVDVGITAFLPAQYAKKHGLELIICDHHEPNEIVPIAHSILDPLLPGDNYPYKSLSASGVVFKLIQGIGEKLNLGDMVYSYLDLVAIASISDMVPLVDENRVFVHYGVKQINDKPRPGIRGLLYCTGLEKGEVLSTNIVYAMAPLINAAGRLGDANRSVDMLLQKDVNMSFRIAQELEDENRKRRLLDQQVFDEAIPLAEDMLRFGKHRSLVLHNSSWHAGVIGIVASRLVDRYKVPTILLTTIDGMAKGSARSINNFDIYSALKKNAHYLVEFGGHRHAAGLTLKVDDVPEFRKRIDEIASSQITEEMLQPEIKVDGVLPFNELSPVLLNSLNLLAPFGYSNDRPLFVARGVKSINGIKFIGNNTFKFRAMQSNFVIDAIAPLLSAKAGIVTNGKPFSIVYTIDGIGQGSIKLPQLNIKDIAPDD
ncbi:MAG: single-stranded-DNA-specific exonuclease RecJ [Ignavibacteria bacterium GWF2_33_9]|nr:MAG: single-stranded-DNA-specific exonuclease RecJ [Ignavibacteria bacterium GWF2_33_9]